MHLARDTAVSALSSVVGTGARLLVTAMLARKLAPEAYGQFVFIQFVIDLIGLMCSFGLSGVFTRYLPQLATARELKSEALIRRLCLFSFSSILLSASALLIYSNLDSHLARFDLRILMLWCAVSVGLNFIYAALQGIFRYDAVFAGNLAYAASAPVLVSILARPGSPVSGAGALSLAVVVSASAALLTWKIRPVQPSNSAFAQVPSTREVVSYALNVWITGLIVSLVWSRGEFAILRAFASDATIGIYGVALTTTGLITQSAGLFTGALTPHLVRHWTARDEVELEKTLTQITSLLLLASCGAATFLIAFGPLLIRAFFGDAYSGAQQLIYILTVGGVAIASGPANLLLQIQSNARFGLFTNLLALVLLLLASAALTPIVGTSGAAIARALSQITVGAISLWQLRHLPGLADPARRLLGAWLTSIFAVASFAGFVAGMSPGPIVKIVVMAATLLFLLWATHRILGTSPYKLIRDYVDARTKV